MRNQPGGCTSARGGKFYLVDTGRDAAQVEGDIASWNLEARRQDLAAGDVE